MSAHIVSQKIYFIIFALLIGLTVLTTLVADFNLGRWNTIVALAIAICKATLVILFFMHVKYSSSLTRIAVVAGFFWLAILLTFTLSDILTRSWIPESSGWQTTSVESPH